MRRLSVLLILTMLAGAGCARGIGAKRLPIDRTAYIEALSSSWKEQVLYNIVKLRYKEPPTYLDVSSITQGYTLQASAGANFAHTWSALGAATQKVVTVTQGGGTNVQTTTSPNANPSNTVSAGPISGSYETLPTVTYTPSSADAFKASLFGPISINDVSRALADDWPAGIVFPYLVKSVNNLRNNPNGNLEFIKVVQAWTNLAKNGVLRVVFEDESKSEAPTIDEKTGKMKSKPDNWEESASNLATFTSNLVKAQDEKSKENTNYPFLILNHALANTPDLDNDLKKLKDYLNLVDDSQGKLIDKCRRLLTTKNSFSNDALNLLRCGLQLTDKQIKENKDAIRKFLGFPTEITSQEQETLREIIGKDANIEKFKIVEGIPNRTTNLSKIYLTTRSITHVLTILADFVEVPPEDGAKVGPETPWKDWFKELRSVDKDFNYVVDIKSMPAGMKPELFTRPKEFTAVKYGDNWFYVPDDAVKSKYILSSVVGLFTMMPTGATKQSTPTLTLPVR